MGGQPSLVVQDVEGEGAHIATVKVAAWCTWLIGAADAGCPSRNCRNAARSSWLPGQIMTGCRESSSRRACCARHGLALRGLTELHHDPAGRPQGLLIGFAAPSEHAYPAALEALFTALTSDGRGDAPIGAWLTGFAVSYRK